MNIVIMGCGRVGARVASTLDHQGHRVSIIDIEPHAFSRLPPEFGGDTIIGTGIDEDVLKAAGIEEADAFIATSNGDNRNIMAGQVARVMFGVQRVVLRIYDPVREDTYRRLGYTTACPTTKISSLIIDSIIQASAETSRHDTVAEGA